jgi:hypothetical protein
MRQISFQQKMEVIELYLKGLSTNEIVDKSQISKGTVVSILADAREGKFPGMDLKDRIDELHTLSVRLKKEALDLTQTKLGFSFLRRLLDIDIEPVLPGHQEGEVFAVGRNLESGFLRVAEEILHRNQPYFFGRRRSLFTTPGHNDKHASYARAEQILDGHENFLKLRID